MIDYSVTQDNKEIAKEEVEAIVKRYSLIVAGEIIAIPVPGLDMAAVFLTWGRMIQEIGTLYGQKLSLADTRKLAWSFFLSGLSAGGAWFGSATIAKSILKAFPIGGTLAAYLIDAIIAGSAIGNISSTLTSAAEEHFQEMIGKKNKKVITPYDTLRRVVSTVRSVALIVNGFKK